MAILSTKPMTPTELIQELRDSEALLKSYNNRLRVLRTNRDNTEFVDRSIEEKRATIARMQKELDELVYSRDNADDIIEQVTEERDALREKVAATRNNKTIIALLELLAKEEALRNEC